MPPPIFRSICISTAAKFKATCDGGLTAANSLWQKVLQRAKEDKLKHIPPCPGLLPQAAN